MNKRVAVLSLAGLAMLGTAVSLAGSPAAAPVKQVYGVFIGMVVGTVYNTALDKTAREWAVVEGQTYTSSFVFNNKKKTPWGWSASGLVGYQFNNHWAVQAGYIWDQRQKAEFYNGALTDYYKFDQYHWYLAFKGLLPLTHRFSAFMLAGFARTRQKLRESKSTGVFATDLKYNFWSPVGAIGLSYRISHGFSTNIQYMYIMGRNELPLANSEHVVMGASTQRLTVGLNYLFTL